jgi:hypothetical protein
MPLAASLHFGLFNASPPFKVKNRLLTVVATAEALTGLALLIAPGLVGWLLLGVGLTDAAVPAACVAGIALIGLSIACLSGPALIGMLTYSTLVTLYLGYVGLTGVFVGILLWPAVVVHAVLTLFLARLWFKPQRDRPT